MTEKTVFSAAHRKALSDACRGKKRNEEQRARISAGKKASWGRIHAALRLLEQQQQQSLVG